MKENKMHMSEEGKQVMSSEIGFIGEAIKEYVYDHGK